MKIHFTKKEFRQLMEMAYIADWVASSHLVDGSDGTYFPLLQKIYAQAEAFGIKDALEYIHHHDTYYELSDFEEPLQNDIHQFIERTLTQLIEAQNEDDPESF